MSTSHQPQVLIIGGGPVGSLLAGLLATSGVRTTVLEKDRAILAQSRASTLDSRSMEILSAAKVPDLTAIPRIPFAHYAGVPVQISGVDSAWAGLWRWPQPDLVRALRQWAIEQGAAYELNEAAVEVDLADELRVRTSLNRLFRPRYVVAADGYNSPTRHALGVTDDVTAPATRWFARCDVVGSVHSRRFEHFPGGAVATAGPLSESIARLMLTRPAYNGSQPASGESFLDDWRTVTGEDLTGRQIKWFDQFSNKAHIAHLFRRGPVFFAGDAAHYQPPVGGGSLNTGLQDANNLAWKLKAALAGAPDTLLDSYATERRAAAYAMQRSTITQEEILFGSERTTQTCVADAMDKSPQLRRRTEALIAGLATHYLTPTQVGPRLSVRQLDALLSRPALPHEIAALGRRPLVIRDRVGVQAVIRPDAHIAWLGGHPTSETSDTIIDRWLSHCETPLILEAHHDPS